MGIFSENVGPVTLMVCEATWGRRGGGGVTPSTPRLNPNNYANDLAVCRGTLLAHKSPSVLQLVIGHGT